jgi:hypothetical protein
MDSLKAADVIAKTMANAGAPLTDDQQLLLAGSLAVCLQAATDAERDRIAKHMGDCFESLARRFARHGELTTELWKAAATMRA